MWVHSGCEKEREKGEIWKKREKVLETLNQEESSAHAMCISSKNMYNIHTVSRIIDSFQKKIISSFTSIIYE